MLLLQVMVKWVEDMICPNFVARVWIECDDIVVDDSNIL